MDNPSPGEKGWVTEAWVAEFGTHEGESPLSDCYTVGGDCDTGAHSKCTDFKVNAGYWLFRSVEKLHSKISTLHSTLQDNAISTNLQIPAIKEDFSLPKPDAPKWLAIVSSGLGFAATGVGQANPEAGTLVGLLGSSFAAAGASMGEAEGQVDDGELEVALANIFDNAVHSLNVTLSTALGVGGNAAKLPSDNSPLRHGTARFFDDPGIVIDETTETGSTWTKVLNQFHNNLVSSVYTSIFHIALLIVKYSPRRLSKKP